MLIFSVICMYLVLLRTEAATSESNSFAENTRGNITESFKGLEKEVESLIKLISKQVISQFSQMSYLNISSSCMSTLMKMFLDFRRMKIPMIKMLDAMPKIPYGMLKGTFSIMGDYDECLEIKVNKKGDFALTEDEEVYHGQYCIMDVRLPPDIVNGYIDYRNGRINISSFGKLGEFFQEFSVVNFETEYTAFKVGVCLPSTCSATDLQELLNIVPVSALTMNVKNCDDGRLQQLTVGQIIFLSFLFLLATCIAIATILEMRPSSTNLASEKHTNKLVEFFMAFSIYKNTQKLMNVKRSQSDSQIPSVNGMYVIGSLFIIVYHTYFMPYFTIYSSHAVYLTEIMNSWDFTIMSTMGISIDVYFLFSGIFIIYPRYRRDGKQMKVNLYQIIVRRYLKFLPSMLLVLGIIISMPLFGSGPVWPEIFGSAVDNVNKWWWHYVLMFNNFLTVKDQSFFPLWFVACLMQITIIGAILLWFTSKNLKLGIFLTLLTSVSCNIALGYLTYLWNYPLTYALYYNHKRDYFETTIYTSPLSHVSSYGIGFLLGIFLAKTPNLKLSKVYVLVGWIFSIIFVFGTHFVCYIGHTGQDLDPIFTAIFAATHRPLYTLGIAWMVMACHYGYGGILGEFMTWNGFGVLAKLSYSGYLLHYVVIAYHVSSIRAPLVFSHYEMFIRYSGYITITILVSFFFYVTFELPMTYLESLLWPRRIESNMHNNLKNQVNGKCGNDSSAKENGALDPSMFKLPIPEEHKLSYSEVCKL